MPRLCLSACVLLAPQLIAQSNDEAISNSVRDLAAAGKSAGVVVTLAGSAPGNGSPFDALFSKGRVPEPLGKDASAGAVLQARFGKERLKHVSGIPILSDPAAEACHRLIQTPVVLNTSAVMFTTVVTAFNQVSGQSVADGAMGTCMPLAFSTGKRPDIKPRAGATMEEVLTAAAAAEPGSVWVAVAAQDGTCTIGLMMQGEHGRVCSVQIGDPVKVLQ